MYLSDLLPVTHCPDCCRFITKLQVKSCPSSHVLLLQHGVHCSGCSVSFPHKPYNQCVTVHNMTCGDVGWGCVESTDQSGSSDILTTLNLLSVNVGLLPLHVALGHLPSELAGFLLEILSVFGDIYTEVCHGEGC